tara:strand:+ start:3356 stop:3787 length:432 start_codon:yes stop_codon:yes gene_type:complete
MSSLILGGMLGGGGGVSVAPGPAQPAPPAFRAATAQAPQIPGVQAQQAPIVNTGAKQQAPQVAQDPKEDEKRKQMIEILIKQGLDQRQIEARLADLADQKFFQSPAERVEETRKVPPRGLLSAGAGETEEEEKQEKPRGILGI